MPSLGFKAQFVPFVLNATKTHTLRGGERFKVGDVCHCFFGLRTKVCRLLGRWRCVKVQSVIVESVQDGIAYKLQLTFDGVILSDDEAREFSWRDGFRHLGPSRSMELFQRFWAIEHKLDSLGAKWYGQLIHWDVRQPVEKILSPKQKNARRAKRKKGS